MTTGFKRVGVEDAFTISCLQGEIDASYAELAALFGEPEEGDGYKVDAEWRLRFADGTYATIYNYKNGVNYCGAEGLATVDIRDWHIGGENKRAVECVYKAVTEARKKPVAKAAHTPAPWKVRAGSINGQWVTDATGCKIANVTRAADRPILEKEANARLIAAAPELLEVLETIVRKHSDLIAPDLPEALAAIAKANKGE